jgi:DNA-binding transcriptional MerR regulator
MKSPNIFADHSGRLALTRIETARTLGISASQIDKLTKRGLLRPSRATRRPLYSVQEIQRFLRDTTAQLEPDGEGVASA